MKVGHNTSTISGGVRNPPPFVADAIDFFSEYLFSEYQGRVKPRRTDLKSFHPASTYRRCRALARVVVVQNFCTETDGPGAVAACLP